MEIGRTATPVPWPRATAGFGAPAPREDAAAAQSAEVRDTFLKWARMTPEERMRANVLASLGLTEESLAAMEPEERKKIEEKVREMIREKIERSTGVPGRLADVTV